ncbi:MAG: hypothetical protein D3906_16695, partial [Candidatus Electrothrix sp. AUS1_2]|nr:hypothetical protein [Candidatus Electrothrix sp. AUS1_2]
MTVEFLPRCLRWSDRNIFLLVTLSFVSGIVTAHTRLFTLPDLLLPAAILFFAATPFLLYLKSRTSTLFSLLLTLPLFFLLGYFALLHQVGKPQAQGHIATLLTKKQQVTLVGTRCQDKKKRLGTMFRNIPPCRKSGRKPGIRSKKNVFFTG